MISFWRFSFLHFTQRPNISGIGLVELLHIEADISNWKSWFPSGFTSNCSKLHSAFKGADDAPTDTILNDHNHFRDLSRKHTSQFSVFCVCVCVKCFFTSSAVGAAEPRSAGAGAVLGGAGASVLTAAAVGAVGPPASFLTHTVTADTCKHTHTHAGSQFTSRLS